MGDKKTEKTIEISMEKYEDLVKMDGILDSAARFISVSDRVDNPEVKFQILVGILGKTYYLPKKETADATVSNDGPFIR